MSLEDDIKQVEARRRKLLPYVQEYERLSTSIRSIERELRRLEGGVEGRTSLDRRKAQISEILDRNPDVTNEKIADELGITPARISQIRKGMGRPSNWRKSHVGP